MPITKRYGPSPWEVTEFHTPGALDTLPDDLPDAQLLAPEPVIEEAQRGYRALAAAVLGQLVRDMTVAARKDLQGTLRYASWLSAQEDTFSVWCQVLGLDTEEWIDTLIERLTAKCMLHGEGAAAD